MEKILITGALGQIGTDLTAKLREKYGKDNVIATDLREDPESAVCTDGKFETLDVMDKEKMLSIAKENQVDTLIHMAALLSAVAEEKPGMAWDLNMGGLVNALEVARELDLLFFTPSSIGAFGPDTPKDNTPQNTLMRPTTMYGVTKVSGELLCLYYHKKFGVDTRSVRFPGLISYTALPGGGTTDYAVDIFYKALEDKKYASFIDKGTYMDMMYMPDAIQLVIDLLEAPEENLKNRIAYNVSAMSFEPEEIAAEVKKHIPEFEMTYDVDPVRQGIAESWPNSLDVSKAKEEWNFSPQYDLEKMTADMLEKLSAKMK